MAPSESRSQAGGSRASRSGSVAKPVEGSESGGSQAGDAPPGSPRGSRMSPGTIEKMKASGAEYDKVRGIWATPKPDNPRLDLPAEAFRDLSKDTFTPFIMRPGLGTNASKDKISPAPKAIKIQVNQFRVAGLDLSDTFQFDVQISPTPTRLGGLMRDMWASKPVQNELTKYPKLWIHDGRNLAWSRNQIPRGGIRVMVDMDVERGRKPNPQRPNKFYLLIKQTTLIRLSVLDQYLRQKTDWNIHVLEAMNLLDHLIRMSPSRLLTPIKRSFYSLKKAKCQDLSRCLEVRKGLFASIRLCSSWRDGGSGLGINVDISNTAFWKAMSGDKLICLYIAGCEDRFNNFTPRDVANALRPVRNPGENRPQPSDAWRYLRRLEKLRFQVRHRGKMNDTKIYSVRGFANPLNYGPEGGTPNNVRFTNKEGLEVSIKQHFAKTYDIVLQHDYLPCIESARGGFYPPEVASFIPLQRYLYKLDPNETSAMIKFAASRPTERFNDMSEGVQALEWQKCAYLREFGIRIEPALPSIPASLIQNPEIHFSNTKHNPGMTGRWDLRGKKFVSCPKEPLVAWGFVWAECRRVNKPQVEAWARAFVKNYQGLGGLVGGPPVWVQYSSNNPSDVIEKAYNEIVKQKRLPPQILFVIVPNKNIRTYERYKKSCECRFGMLSQMLHEPHIGKVNDQYCCNVAMKVNAKLGGQTTRIPGRPNGGSFFVRPTIVFGVDVSHVGPGLPGASMAAVTASMDKDGARFAAKVETNGVRQELLTSINIETMFPALLNQWRSANGCVPEHVFYFRDGVGEGQFAEVVDIEVRQIRDVFKSLFNKSPKFTVIIATKRHHIKFFPGRAGDRNQNPLPGTLVEREVTHPFHYDFYLCSHVAIQGTARPVHYHVLADEIGLEPVELQRMIYHQCYQYIRSTTPVSLHPAVYYAHLAGARARAHENLSQSEHRYAPKSSHPLGKAPSDTTSQMGHEVMPVVAMGVEKNLHPGSVKFTNETMWYI